MPRIKSKRKEYMVKDIGRCIYGKMKEKGFTQSDLAREIGITQQAFGAKLNGTAQFNYKDLIIIFSTLKLTDEEILKTMKE